MTVVVAISGKKQSGKSTLAEYLTYWYQLGVLGLDFEILQNEVGEINLDIPESVSFDFDIDNSNVSYFDDATQSGFKGPPDISSYSFADPLKDICMNVLGLSYEQVHGTDAQKNSLTRYSWKNLPHEIQLTRKETSSAAIRADRLDAMTAREVMQILGTNVMRCMFHDKVWVDATFRQIQSDNKRVALIPDTRFPSEIEAIMENNGYIIRLARDVSNGDTHPSETSLDDFDFEGVCGDRCCIVPDISMFEKNRLACEFLLPILNGEKL